ncbi:hypothetical protein GF402_03310 [Candidatus Fermentibacteria bacterium]|nr:hypothetical protein [Candidatus Fermentibacteria bacterium]
MAGRSFFLRETIDSLLSAKWISTYLLVPPILALLVFIESYLNQVGIAGPFAVGERITLALWNASLLLTLIAGVQSSVFFSGSFGSNWFRNSLALPVPRWTGYWGSFLGFLVIVTGVFALTISAIVAALRSPTQFPWLESLLVVYVPLLWGVSAGLLLGILTTAGAAVFLFVGIMTVGLAGGLPWALARVPEWAGRLFRVLVPPLGSALSANMSSPGNIRALVPLLAHAAVALALGYLLYSVGIKRR